MVDAFTRLCQEQIGYYVYALLDTREEGLFKRIFYIGKGVGDRCHQHARAALKSNEIEEEQLKLARIREILKATGKPPDVKIIAHGLPSDEEAFRLEALSIGLFQPLANAIKGKGHRDYWLSDDELDARYKHPLPRSALSGNVLLVSLNGKKGAVGKRDMSPYPLIKDDPAKLSDRTLGQWPVSPEKAKNIDYVIGVYRGLTRCVFKIEKDIHGARFTTLSPRKPRGKRRVIFVGDLIKKEEWTLRTIVSGSKILTKFAPQSACRMLPDTRRSATHSLSKSQIVNRGT